MTYMQTITSRDNSQVKNYIQLASSRKERAAQGQFVTEGCKLTREAYDAGCVPATLFVTKSAAEKYSQELEEIFLSAQNIYEISDNVSQKMTQTVTPQGVFGIFHMLDKERQDVKINDHGRYLLLSSLQDPGNIGTILRTAAALGIDGIFLSSDCPDIYSPKVLRCTMGGVFKLPVTVSLDLRQLISRLKNAGITVYAAALTDDAVSLKEACLGSGCAVVIGNEGNGIRGDVLAECSRALIIPMRPDSESLNAAMAAGIIMWEMTK